MKVIPFDPSISSRQNFSVNLGEYVCEFSLYWNERADSWFCNLRTTQGENNSVRLVENSPLLGSLNSTGLSGDFRVLKTRKSGLDHITYENLGIDWSIVYASKSEWEEFDGVQT